MAGKVRLFSISAIQLEIQKSKPPQLAVTVHGYAVSSGWTDPGLVPLEKTLSADGILDLDFVGTPPSKVDLPMLTPMTAELTWTDGVDRLVGVRVVARSGAVIELLPRAPAQTTTQPAAEETTQIAGEGPHPHFAQLAAAGGATTMVVGEEGQPPMSTMALGEETPMTTLMLGEECPPRTTAPRWEEVVADRLPDTALARGVATTLMDGEESVPDTTSVEGEERDAPRIAAPSTLIGGEETVFHPTHPAWEGKPPWGETSPRWDNPKIPWGETNPATDDPKNPVGEGWYDPQNFNPLGRR